MRPELKELQDDVLNEQKHIEETVRLLLQLKLSDALQKNSLTHEPAMGVYLMNFYNGIENILKRIGKIYYRTFPTGSGWHKELLDLSCHPPEGCLPIFSEEIVRQLYQYKNFRHRFISGYGFQLKAEKMAGLVDQVERLWLEIQHHLDVFIKAVGNDNPDIKKDNS